EALNRLEKGVDPALRSRLTLQLADLAEAPLPTADLVNASFVLPFLSKAVFPGLWGRIRAALVPGGRFAGQLLGERDSWIASGRCHGFTASELEGLLRPFIVETLEEEESDSVTPRGESKHWHIWHLNLRVP